jgi:hypothetical protein
MEGRNTNIGSLSRPPTPHLPLPSINTNNKPRMKRKRERENKMTPDGSGENHEEGK